MKKQLLLIVILMPIVTSCRNPHQSSFVLDDHVINRASVAGLTKNGVVSNVALRGVSVGLPQGLVKVNELVIKAQSYLAKKEKNFRPTDYSAAVDIHLQDQRRSVRVLFSRDLGEPCWEVTLDSTGEISGFRAGTLAEQIEVSPIPPME